MSFSNIVKKELCEYHNNIEEAKCELAAFIKFNGSLNITNKELTLELTTENAMIARRIYTLIKDIYHLELKTLITKQQKLNKNHTYNISLKDNIQEILELTDLDAITSLDPENQEDFQKICAFLRGSFSAKGSISDPKINQYHLEIATLDDELAYMCMNLFNKLDLSAKVIKRSRSRISKYIIYIKEAEKISDYLRYADAHQALLYFEDIRIYRDYKNSVNRINNCEQANIEKSMNAANEQIEKINLILKHYEVAMLDPKLYTIMQYRLKYPEYSLQELSDQITNDEFKLSKSGLNHRIRSLNQLIERIKKGD